MLQVTLDEADRLDWALKQFKRKVQKAGVLKDLRKKRHYEKPSVVRQRKAFRRKDGSYIRFDENAVVIIEGTGKNAKEPKAGRIFGPIPRELSELGYQTIISRAPEVV